MTPPRRRNFVWCNEGLLSFPLWKGLGVDYGAAFLKHHTIISVVIIMAINDNIVVFDSLARIKTVKQTFAQ